MTLPLRELEGKYEILLKIREGGMGAIYKVRHRLLDEVRVIKVIRPQIAGDTALQQRFLREARVATNLRHPHIAQLYDFAVDEDEGTSYMVMEFIDGITFEDLLRRGGPPGQGLALQMAEQGLEALEYLHERGYIHRDISPDNLMITRSFNSREPLVKLIDLGIAKNLGAGDGLTQTGMFMGKLRYASPEQFASKEGEPDRRSDVYSFGILLYELLTGTCPIEGSSIQELVSAHLVRGPVGFDRSDPDGRVPPGLRQVVLAMLARRPADRPATAAEVIAALAPFQGSDQGEVKRDLDRTLHLAATKIAGAPERPTAGSTQERLDARFAPLTTPPPERSLRQVPSEADARAERVAELLANARLLARLDQHAQAIRELERLLALDAGHREAASLLAEMRQAQAAAPACAGAPRRPEPGVGGAGRAARPAAPPGLGGGAPAGRPAGPALLERPATGAPPATGEAPAAGERPEGPEQRLEEARRSIAAALDAADLDRAERELDFAAAHYGGAADLRDLRRLLDRARAARRATEAWTGAAQSPETERPARPASRFAEGVLGARVLVPAVLGLLALVAVLVVSFCAG